ncbi:hypothetical protein HELRODRAFT_179139 [Helobdella robusta]|uniref:Uncharacterized protein n=1 Tax=Helobdella robusta TaxID=6412 RepID=T1FE82_HELRO|nr:hypothetical protein HELRODRAFT_179139 [Helobdella robusta]ESN95668.1 hypothetical protein HELRODRAFT_179139 [Helobdella robusta]
MCHNRNKERDSDGVDVGPETHIRGVNAEETYIYLGMKEVEGIQQQMMKEQIKKEYNNRIRSILKTQLNAKNKVIAINSLAIPQLQNQQPQQQQQQINNNNYNNNHNHKKNNKGGKKTSRGGRRVNQGNLVNKRLSEYSTIGLKTMVLCFDGFNNAKSQKHNPDRWMNAVSSCIEQGNLSSAVRLVCSPDGLTESSPATFNKFCSIHPKIPVDRRVFPALAPTAGCVSPAEVLRAVKPFKNGSSGGLDGL